MGRRARVSSGRGFGFYRGPFGFLGRWPGRGRNPQRVDIEGGGVELFERDPITGPVGVLVCGGGGGAVVVGFGGVVGFGRVGGGSLAEGGGAEVLVDEDCGCESLMTPPLGRSACDVPPGAIGSPLGRSVSLELVPAPVEEITALFVSCPGC